MNQPNRLTGHTALTTANDAEEALLRVQGRPAPTTKPQTFAAVAA
ncbi:hypothetical protein NKH18_21170 [Streptomyces sp. M10(2022)]